MAVQSYVALLGCNQVSVSNAESETSSASDYIHQSSYSHGIYRSWQRVPCTHCKPSLNLRQVSVMAIDNEKVQIPIMGYKIRNILNNWMRRIRPPGCQIIQRIKSTFFWRAPLVGVGTIHGGFRRSGKPSVSHQALNRRVQPATAANIAIQKLADLLGKICALSIDNAASHGSWSLVLFLASTNPSHYTTGLGPTHHCDLNHFLKQI